MPKIGDVIELTVDLPAHRLSAGMRGTIVHCHADNAYEIEFANDHGETIDFLAAAPAEFIVVWRADTREWASVTEQATAVIAQLPRDAAAEVLDFARFLLTRKHQFATF